jgi:hypothetical protein
VAGAIPGLLEYEVGEVNHAYQLRGNEYPVNEEILNGLRTFLREHPRLRAQESKLNENLDYVRRRLRAELITASYGIEKGEQFLMESDPQALRAVEELPKAKLLSERARLFKSESRLRPDQ